MKEVSKKYVLDIEGYADISVEISSNGSVQILGWPEYTVTAETFIRAMRTLADRVKEITEK